MVTKKGILISVFAHFSGGVQLKKKKKSTPVVLTFSSNKLLFYRRLTSLLLVLVVLHEQIQGGVHGGSCDSKSDQASILVVSYFVHSRMLEYSRLCLNITLTGC